jgi:hypothetical protein
MLHRLPEIEITGRDDRAMCQCRAADGARPPDARDERRSKEGRRGEEEIERGETGGESETNRTRRRVRRRARGGEGEMKLGLGFLIWPGRGGLYIPGAVEPQRSDGNSRMERAAGYQRLSCRARGPLIVPLTGRPISRVVPRAVPRADFEAQALARH